MGQNLHASNPHAWTLDLKFSAGSDLQALNAAQCRQWTSWLKLGPCPCIVSATFNKCIIPLCRFRFDQNTQSRTLFIADFFSKATRRRRSNRLRSEAS